MNVPTATTEKASHGDGPPGTGVGDVDLGVAGVVVVVLGFVPV
jgi:hypothetical protein